MQYSVLSANELENLVHQLPHWKITNTEISRTFIFSSFTDAFAFLTKVALLSEKLNHHAHWDAVYNTVTLTLTTHDANGITHLDVSFADEVSRWV